MIGPPTESGAESESVWQPQPPSRLRLGLGRSRRVSGGLQWDWACQWALGHRDGGQGPGPAGAGLYRKIISKIFLSLPFLCSGESAIATLNLLFLYSRTRRGNINRRPCPRVRPRGYTTQRARRDSSCHCISLPGPACSSFNSRCGSRSLPRLPPPALPSP